MYNNNNMQTSDSRLTKTLHITVLMFRQALHTQKYGDRKCSTKNHKKHLLLTNCALYRICPI